MTILQVCAFAAPNPGNFIAALSHLEMTLAQHGVQTIYAFAETAKDKPWCKEIQTRTKVYFLPVAKARILPKTYSIMRKIYRENKIDIAHSHFELYDIPIAVTAPKHTKIFWHLHDAIKLLYVDAQMSRKIMTRIQYSALWKRPVLLSVSKEHAEFVEKLGFNKKRVCYFPNGINTARILPTPLQKEKPNFLMFGWEVMRKGVDLVIQAAQDMKAGACQIRIVGLDQCADYIEKSSANACVTYQKPVDSINALYKDTSVFLHVSRAEGQSYALLEVIYAGIPVICSDIPENEFAREFRNVFFVKNQSVQEIRDLICQFAENPPIVSEEDALYNRKIIEDQYSVEAWSRKLTAVYLEDRI